MSNGIDVGIKKGEENNKKEIARKMKERKIDIEVIVELTGLTKEEIERIK